MFKKIESLPFSPPLQGVIYKLPLRGFVFLTGRELNHTEIYIKTSLWLSNLWSYTLVKLNQIKLIFVEK